MSDAPRKAGRPRNNIAKVDVDTKCLGFVKKPQNPENSELEIICGIPHILNNCSQQFKLLKTRSVTIIAEKTRIIIMANSEGNTAGFAIVIPAETCQSYYLKTPQTYTLAYENKANSFKMFTERISKQAHAISFFVTSGTPIMKFVSTETHMVGKFQSPFTTDKSKDVDLMMNMFGLGTSVSDIVVNMSDSDKTIKAFISALNTVNNNSEHSMYTVPLEFYPALCVFKFSGDKGSVAEFCPVRVVTEAHKAMPALKMTIPERFINIIIKYAKQYAKQCASGITISAKSGNYFRLSGDISIKNSHTVMFTAYVKDEYTNTNKKVVL